MTKDWSKQKLPLGETLGHDEKGNPTIIAKFPEIGIVVMYLIPVGKKVSNELQTLAVRLRAVTPPEDLVEFGVDPNDSDAFFLEHAAEALLLAQAETTGRYMEAFSLLRQKSDLRLLPPHARGLDD